MIYGDSLEELKGNLAEGELEFLGKYEPPIRELFGELAGKGAIKTAFTREQSERLTLYRITLNSVAYLHQNVMNFTGFSVEKRNKLIDYLKSEGLVMENLGDQMFSIIANGYHNHIEDLKIHMELFIDFGLICAELGKNERDFKSFKWMVDRLKEIKENNNFLEFLSSKTRNSIAHKTYFFKDGMIHFCDEIFDNDPITMELSDFMIESKNMNILALSFIHIWGDMFKNK